MKNNTDIQELQTKIRDILAGLSLSGRYVESSTEELLALFTSYAEKREKKLRNHVTPDEEEMECESSCQEDTYEHGWNDAIAQMDLNWSQIDYQYQNDMYEEVRQGKVLCSRHKIPLRCIDCFKELKAFEEKSLEEA